MTESERKAASEKYYQELREKLDERVRKDSRLNALSRKIAENAADFNDTAQYSEIVSNHIAAVLQENIGEITSPLAKEFVCTELLKDHHSAINETLGRVQVSIDEKSGIHLNPQKAPFPFERVRQVARALEDPTVKPETIRRRANAPVANVAKSFHDDYIRTNAKLRNDLGLKPVIQRYGANCCAWCSAVAGKYRFGEQPEDIFRRHDNCNCIIIYDTQVLRGKQTADGGRSKTWEEVDPSDFVQDQPTVFTQEQAKAIEQRNLQYKGLTNASRSGTIELESLKMSAPLQQPPDFTKYEVKSDLAAVESIKSEVTSKFDIPMSDIKLDGIQNTEVLEPFVKRFEKIQKETGVKIPAIRSLDIIDGDEMCVASFKRYENTLYISSKYFNSKEALVDTLKDWVDKGILPKQAKSIAYLAEHEAAHIRIPDALLETKQAVQIWKKRKLLNNNDSDIYEYYADATAIYRINPHINDNNIIQAIEYLRNGGVTI